MKRVRNCRRRFLAMEGLETRSLLTTTLAISEINYEPYEPVAAFGDALVESTEFEFIELLNTGEQPVNLAGLRLAQVVIDGSPQGVNCSLNPGSLAPGARTVAVRNPAAFRTRYGDEVPIACQWSGGGLSNQGETLTLLDAQGTTIVQVTYGSDRDWPTRADGLGASLVIKDVTWDPNDPDNWRSSPEYGGSPGRDSAERTPRVLINEVLAHTDPPHVDFVEFHNLTDSPINVSRWYFSDRIGNPFNYAFPPQTVIPAGGYLVIDEGDFNPGGGSRPTDFAISERGDRLLLISADVNRRPLFIEDYAVIEATANGVSVGNVADIRDGLELLPLSSLTLSEPNGSHRQGEFVVSEVQYHPPDDDVYKEFIEIMNNTRSRRPLDDWQVTEGVDMGIPPGTLLDPGEVVVLVAFDPRDTVRAAAFREYYEIDSAVRLIGPWSSDNSGDPDTLSNNGETLTLRIPMDDVDLVVYGAVDQVKYNDKAPWSEVADGNGGSLSRTAPSAYGNLPDSWQGTRPSPGNQPPNLSASPTISTDQPVSAELGRDGGLLRGAADIDTYRFKPLNRGTFAIQTEAEGPFGAGTFLRLFSLDGEELAFSDDQGDTRSSRLEVQLQANVEYLIVVSGSSDNPRDYNPFTGTGLVAGSQGNYVLSVSEIVVNPFPWHNLTLPEDVNGDGVVVPFDALLIINELNTNGSVPLPMPPEAPRVPPPYLDVQSDNVLAPIDALLVINYLNTPNGIDAEGEGYDMHLTASRRNMRSHSAPPGFGDTLSVETIMGTLDWRLIAAAFDLWTDPAAPKKSAGRSPRGTETYGADRQDTDIFNHLLTTR